jgi:hypothetical protein
MIVQALLEGNSVRLLEDHVGVGKGFGNGYGYVSEYGNGCFPFLGRGYGKGCFDAGGGYGDGKGDGSGEGSGSGSAFSIGYLTAILGIGSGISCGCRDNDIYVEEETSLVYIVEG